MRPLRLCALLAILLAGSPTTSAARPAVSTEPENRFLGVASDVLTSTWNGEAVLPRASAVDTFVLFGDAGSFEGKFETTQGDPTFGTWTPVDHTKKPFAVDRWQVSTFNAETLGNHGVGNHALWCGAETGENWESAPGYGNDWYEGVLYESTRIDDPTAGQVVDLDFYFHHDLETAYDFLFVEYQRAGAWVRVLDVDGTDAVGGVFSAPGTRFSDVQLLPIEYSGSDYGDGDRIRIRIVVQTDGAYSDEDGDFDSDGAVQIDDITLTTSQGTFSEDFEGPGPYLFEPTRLVPFVGDFSEVYSGLPDADPCHENATGVVAFIDTGQVLRNGPGVDGSTSTGGSQPGGLYTEQYGYGWGGYVVNHSGGLAGGYYDWIDNVVTHEVDLTLPEPHASDPEMVGYTISFDVYEHTYGGQRGTMQFRWKDADGVWSDRLFWVDARESYPSWKRTEYDLARSIPELVDGTAVAAEVSLGVIENGYFGALHITSTPAPYFDNVRFVRHRVGGPRIELHASDLPQDAYPAADVIAHATQSDRDALDIRFDQAGLAFDPQFLDVIPFTVTPRARGASVAEVSVVWTLRRNPTFEDAIRELPARPVDRDVTVNGVLWSGVVDATSLAGEPNYWEDRWEFELPDVDFLYPGDVLHYYVRAVDSDGRVSTLPADLTGFGEFHGPGSTRSHYDPLFTVEGLPSIGFADLKGSSDQPHLLVISDTANAASEEHVLEALRVAGYRPGIDVDVLSMHIGGNWQLSPDDGSTIAPSASHLEGYDTVVVSTRELDYNDLESVVRALRTWQDLPADRSIIWFGEYAARRLFDADVDRAWVGISGEGFETIDMTAGSGPTFHPTGGSPLQFDGAVQGFCPFRATIRDLFIVDGIVGHEFVDGQGLSLGAASITKARTGPDGFVDTNILFPFALDRLEPGDHASVAEASGTLLRDALEALGTYQGGAVDAPSGPRRLLLGARPNPFNPATTVSLTVPRSGRATVKIFDPRGALVRTLHDGALDAGRHEFTWDGRDDRSQPVGSGVYFVRAIAAGSALTKKIAAVK